MADDAGAVVNEKPPAGCRPRWCAECGQVMLVNLGSADDLAAEVFCERCETGQAFAGPLLVEVGSEAGTRVVFLEEVSDGVQCPW